MSRDRASKRAGDTRLYDCACRTPGAVRPVAFWIAVGTVVIMAGWSVTAATYLAFRDDVLRTLIARQAQQQFGYEDRIAELRAQIDRTTSRQLLDQEQFEQKLDELVHRQATLESRAAALGNFADPATTGSIGGAALRGRDSVEPLRNDRGRQSSIGTTLDRMEASLDRIDRRQSLALGNWTIVTKSPHTASAACSISSE